MRLKTMILLVGISLMAFMMPILAQEETPEASPVSENLDTLQGANIYFTEANGEASS